MGVEHILRAKLLEALQAVEQARADAKVLAHAYLHDVKPPMDCVQRAYGYLQLVPVDPDDEVTAVTVRAMPAVKVPGPGAYRSPADVSPRRSPSGRSGSRHVRGTSGS